MEGARQKDTMSARESISFPKLVGMPISRANLPSIESYFEEFGLTYKKLELAKPEALVLQAF